MRLARFVLASSMILAFIASTFSACEIARGERIIPDSELGQLRGGAITTYSPCNAAATSTCPGTFHDCAATNSNSDGSYCRNCNTPVDHNCGAAAGHPGTPVMNDCSAKTTACANAAGGAVHTCSSGTCGGPGGGPGTLNCATDTQPDCNPPR
jgi:hypothetical protein